MDASERKAKVDELFNKIAFIAEVKADDIPLRDKLIQPFVEELDAITKEQMRLHELDYKHIGEANWGDAYEIE